MSGEITSLYVNDSSGSGYRGTGSDLDNAWNALYAPVNEVDFADGSAIYQNVDEYWDGSDISSTRYDWYGAQATGGQAADWLERHPDSMDLTLAGWYNRYYDELDPNWAAQLESDVNWGVDELSYAGVAGDSGDYALGGDGQIVGRIQAIHPRAQAEQLADALAGMTGRQFGGHALAPTNQTSIDSLAILSVGAG